MRLELREDMDKIQISDHSDAEDMITIEKEGTHYHIGINKKFKDRISIDEFTVGEI